MSKAISIFKGLGYAYIFTLIVILIYNALLTFTIWWILCLQTDKRKRIDIRIIRGTIVYNLFNCISIFSKRKFFFSNKYAV